MYGNGKLPKKIKDIFELGYETAMGSAYNLNLKKIVKVTRVFHSKMHGKRGNERSYACRIITNDMHIVNVEKKN